MRQKRSGPGGGDAEAWKIAPDKRSLPMCAIVALGSPTRPATAASAVSHEGKCPLVC